MTPVALQCSHTVHQVFCTVPPFLRSSQTMAQNTDVSDDVHMFFNTVKAPTARHPSQATSSAKKSLVKPFYHRMPFAISALFLH